MKGKPIERPARRLEPLSVARGSARVLPDSGVELASDPSIAAFDDMMAQYVARISDAAEKIGGQVLDVTKILLEAFSVQKELLIQIKQTRKPEKAGLAEFLKPLNEAIMKANAMIEGRQSDFFNHLKSAKDSLSALTWIAYTGKDCGMSVPFAHVEESWRMAEVYNNKVLVSYRNKDQNHVEWAKALQELYLLGLRDYVKSHYPFGPVWSASGKKASSAPSKAPPPGALAPPPPSQPASLISSEPSQPSSSGPKQGMLAVLQGTNTGNVTAGLKKVTADMKTENRTDRAGIVSAGEKETCSSSSSFSKTGPKKLERQMGYKWVVETENGTDRTGVVSAGEKETCSSSSSFLKTGPKKLERQMGCKWVVETENRTDRTGVVSAGGKETCSSSSSFLETGQKKLEQQMGRKRAVENQIGRKNLVIGGSLIGASADVQNIGWGRCYSMKELETATCGFVEENIIGEGGFGVVFRGILQDGSVVAVKNLCNNHGQAEEEFRAEVEAVGKVRHKNLVGLVGYCIAGAQRMLVYEYVENGNLGQWLHGNVGPPLAWDIRMNIARGTARGLAYLHEGLEPKVVHRDVKSTNILLDKMWNAKVSDFGLAKLLGSEASCVITRVMGTFGYVSPEYANTGMLNEGSDVYSFGVLLIEIITGRRPIDNSRPREERNLVEWFKVMVASGSKEELVDPSIEVKPSPTALERALQVCLCCIDLDANKRPKMGQLVHMLEAEGFSFRSEHWPARKRGNLLHRLCR